MVNVSKALRFATIFAALASAAHAEQVEGILLTTMCAAKVAKDGPEAASKHERTCNLKPNCAKTGFGVLTSDHKFMQFDETGNAKALQALEESTKKDDMKVVVTGEIQGSRIAVSTLKLAE